jgi:hypothetical protein
MSGGEVLLYEEPGGQVRMEVRLERETVWLSQAQMAELFGRERSVITKHINKVFADGELGKESNVQNMHIASSDKPVALYSLDVIISVGYRVKSKRGTQFPNLGHADAQGSSGSRLHAERAAAAREGAR